ncbi:hypothetical protein H8356DRAFT_968382 [Neocallimastix lanati (nom. inval.)]|nr:hypothetical protein H8356DRAFT_968382 [Neocallimastix sp. JGI-2020a]
MFLNSSICLLSKAAKSIAPAVLFLLELSPWVAFGLLASGLLASDLLISAAAAGLGFYVAGFSGVLVAFLSPVFWGRAGGASKGVGLLSAATLPTELFNEPLLVVFLVFSGALELLFILSIYFFNNLSSNYGYIHSLIIYLKDYKSVHLLIFI